METGIWQKSDTTAQALRSQIDEGVTSIVLADAFIGRGVQNDFEAVDRHLPLFRYPNLHIDIVQIMPGVNNGISLDDFKKGQISSIFSSSEDSANRPVRVISASGVPR